MIRSFGLGAFALFCALHAAAAQTADSGIDPAPLPGSTGAGEGAEPRPPDDSPTPTFHRRSGQAAGGPANELNTGDARATETLPQGDVGAAATGQDLYHGNFCGIGDRGADQVPTDALDEACRRHDLCYEAATYRSCACDAELKQEALAVAADPSLSRELRKRAASVVQSTDVMGCERR